MEGFTVQYCHFDSDQTQVVGIIFIHLQLQLASLQNTHSPAHIHPLPCRCVMFCLMLWGIKDMNNSNLH